MESCRGLSRPPPHTVTKIPVAQSSLMIGLLSSCLILFASLSHGGSRSTLPILWPGNLSSTRSTVKASSPNCGQETQSLAPSMTTVARSFLLPWTTCVFPLLSLHTCNPDLIYTWWPSSHIPTGTCLSQTIFDCG